MKTSPIFYCLQNIDSRNLHGLDLQNGPMSNVNLAIEMALTTTYVLAIAMFVQSDIVCEIIRTELPIYSIRICLAFEGQ